MAAPGRLRANVDPREIEERLLHFDGVVEVAVLGEREPKQGDVGLAAFVPEPGHALHEDGLRAYLKGRMSGYGIPARFVCLEGMPKSGHGKITKKILRETLRERGLLGGGGRRETGASRHHHAVQMP